MRDARGIARDEGGSTTGRDPSRQDARGTAGAGPNFPLKPQGIGESFERARHAYGTGARVQIDESGLVDEEGTGPRPDGRPKTARGDDTARAIHGSRPVDDPLVEPIPPESKVLGGNRRLRFIFLSRER